MSEPLLTGPRAGVRRERWHPTFAGHSPESVPSLATVAARPSPPPPTELRHRDRDAWNPLALSRGR
ncbi:hypothetical protein ACFY1B_45675 [Streptomyces mirabilis]|uniref:hypothetical protein n=1 Tax=Streptomyces mirabilis TaxID=68239 RepID=UPI0036C43BF9